LNDPGRVHPAGGACRKGKGRFPVCNARIQPCDRDAFLAISDGGGRDVIKSYQRLSANRGRRRRPALMTSRIGEEVIKSHGKSSKVINVAGAGRIPITASECAPALGQRLAVGRGRLARRAAAGPDIDRAHRLLRERGDEHVRPPPACPALTRRRDRLFRQLAFAASSVSDDAQ
jgi:hypothetical protein